VPDSVSAAEWSVSHSTRAVGCVLGQTADRGRPANVGVIGAAGDTRLPDITPIRTLLSIEGETYVTIHAVIFDLDETLTLHEEAHTQGYLAAAKRAARKHAINMEQFTSSAPQTVSALGRNAPVSVYLSSLGIGGRDVLAGHPTDDHPDIRNVAAWAPGFRQRVFAALLQEQGVHNLDLATELVKAYRQAFWDTVRAYPEARPVVEKLRGRYRVAVLTNGLGVTQHEKLRTAGLDDLFDVVASSGDVGIGKPDRRLFDAVLDKVGMSPDEAIMVGDTLHRDVLGARNTGMRSVWINRDGRSARHGPASPDYEIRSLSELPGLIEL